jgi:hypothetical protein
VGHRDIVRRGREKKSFRVGKATLAAVLGLFGSLGAGDGSGPVVALRFFAGNNDGVDGLEPPGPSETSESAATTTILLGSRLRT